MHDDLIVMGGLSMQTDEIDEALIAALRKDGRASHATLAAVVGVTRATVRARLERMERGGLILGYTVQLATEQTGPAVRAHTQVRIMGHKTEAIVDQLARLPWVQRIYSTNGKWDLVVEFAANSNAELDQALSRMRGIAGIENSETNILLRVKA